jgi:hypothetical protein
MSVNLIYIGPNDGDTPGQHIAADGEYYDATDDPICAKVIDQSQPKGSTHRRTR